MKPYLQRKPLVDRADAWHQQCVHNLERNTLTALALALQHACSKERHQLNLAAYYWRIGVHRQKE